MAATEPLKGMADLLILQQRLRQLQNLPELFSFLVNDTRMLLSYRTAAVFSENKLTAVSGLPEPVGTSSFTHWMESFARQRMKVTDYKISELSIADVEPDVAAEWRNFLPNQLLWVPLISPDFEIVGVLILARDQAWKSQELRVLSNWAGAAGHAVEALQLKRNTRWRSVINFKNRGLWLSSLVAFLVVMVIPVRVSVIVPSEIVPDEPYIIRAPIDGVIGEVFISPNALVEEGQTLLVLDDSSLRARLDVAAQELEVAKAEHLRAEQASIADRNASAQIYMLNARIEQREAEVQYVKELMDRIDVRADSSGIAIIDDITELEGRPVALGEKMLTIADPQKVELEAWLPVDDSLPLAVGAEVKMYLNIAPNRPITARLRHTDYQAQVSPDGILAFRVRADFLDSQERSEELRIGLRGSARVYGERVPIYYYLFRRPLALLRQFLGI